ncbi:MAG TPA: DMT family transporter, partial [Burkholderiaceae bacterium]|nr:DMT family transporter [Burkholderiaceae bacterium]
MAHTATHARHDAVAITSLLLGATTWGVIWYPFRQLETAGVHSTLATLATYVVAVAVGAIVFRGAVAELLARARPMLPIALSAGLANVGFLIAVTGTEVVRVVLLFYLAPLWTVPLAWVLLKEHLTRVGYLVVVLAMTGAVVMLWRPELGMPMPKNAYEWIGMAAGFFFACNNVLVRRAAGVSPPAKGLSACIGVLLVALPAALMLGGPSARWLPLALANAWLVATIGIALLATTVAMQFGLTRVPANRAAVILLAELIVAAIASHLLADEVVRLTDWIGGAFIVAAGVLATL